MARCARTGSLTHEVRCGLERVEVGRGGLSADRDPGSGGGWRSRDLERTLRAVKCRVREVDSGGFVPEERRSRCTSPSTLCSVPVWKATQPRTLFPTNWSHIDDIGTAKASPTRGGDQASHDHERGLRATSPQSPYEACGDRRTLSPSKTSALSPELARLRMRQAPF